MARPRIAIVVAHFDTSLDYFETTAASVLSRTCDVHVVTSRFRSPTLTDAGHRGLDQLPLGTRSEGAIVVHRLASSFRQGQRVVGRGLVQSLEGIDPDVIIQVVPTQFFSIPATAYGRKSHTPVIYISGENSQQGPQRGLGHLAKGLYTRTVMQGVIRATAPHAAKVIVTTPETADLVRASSPSSTPVVMALPFRADRFFESPDSGLSKRQSLALGAGHVTLVVGRAIPDKRLEVIIRAWEVVARGTPDSFLVIAGLADDAYSNRIRQLAEATALAARIRLLPFVAHQEVNSLLNMADVTVWPLVSVGIQQAMATGTFVLLPEGSPGCFLLDGPAQLLGATYRTTLESDDVSSLARAIDNSRAMAEPSLRSERSMLAHSLYSDGLTIDRMMQGVLGE